MTPASSGFRPPKRWHRAGLAVLRFAWPTDCFACGAPLEKHQHFGACVSCWTALRPIPPRSACAGCGLAAETDLVRGSGPRCAACLVSPPVWAMVRAAVLYDERARPFLLRAKLGRRPELLRPLAAQLLSVIRHSGVAENCSAVVPVPSHPWSHLVRGFSPGPELAAALAPILGLPVRPLLARRPVAGTALKRHAAGLRKALAMNAFRARRRAEGERVLLIDDVMTSGATAAACSAALLDSGATEVRVAVWARTPPGRE